MSDINSVVLTGRLTRDVELRYTSGGKGVANFGLAVNEKYKKDDEWVDSPVFVEIVVWGRQGEACAEHLSKGSSVAVSGKLNLQSWEEGGQKRSKLEVVAKSVVFTGGKNGA